MAEEAYEKCEKTQGNGIWAEERGTPVERSQGHAAALLKNGPQVRASSHVTDGPGSSFRVHIAQNPLDGRNDTQLLRNSPQLLLPVDVVTTTSSSFLIGQ
jgi:hypothetical protein